MKNAKLFLAGLAFIGLMSCGDDDHDNTNNNSSSNTAQVISTAKSGTWKITSFMDGTNDETGHFTGYTFTFNDNNVLTAQNGTNTYMGTWLVTNSDNSSDDDNSGSDDIDFNIGFSAPADFTDLTDDWDILERTDSRIKLVDVSGGNGGTDYLTFEKN